MDLSTYKHQTDIHIRFMDLDILHHVNNARYLNYLEEARLAYSRDVLKTYENLKELDVVVARIEIDFLRPIQYNESVVIFTRVSKISSKSFVFDSVIAVKEKDEIKPAAKALQTLVAFDSIKRVSKELPEKYKEKIRAFEKVE